MLEIAIKISQYYSFYQMNTALMSRRVSLKNIENITDPKLLISSVYCVMWVYKYTHLLTESIPLLYCIVLFVCSHVFLMLKMYHKNK